MPSNTNSVGMAYVVAPDFNPVKMNMIYDNECRRYDPFSLKCINDQSITSEWIIDINRVKPQYYLYNLFADLRCNELLIFN